MPLKSSFSAFNSGQNLLQDFILVFFYQYSLISLFNLQSRLADDSLR